MITSLTKGQIAKFSEYVKKWTDIGLSTKPADRKEAERGIVLAYAKAGKEVPKIVWCGSPMSSALTRAIVQQIPDQKRASVWASVGASVGDSVRDSVRDSVWASVGASVWASVGASVGDSVRDSVRDSVWASVGASVGDSVGDSVGASVGDSVGDSVRDSVGDSCYGQHDANWLAFYEFFQIECGLTEQTGKLDGLLCQAKSAGWFLPHEKMCWVTERPVIMNRDDRGRLHCEDGPALQYPDGWALYRYHGVTIPEYVIENPIEITIEKIESEANAEVRRVMVERYVGGMAKYVLDSKAEIMHKDSFGTLYRKHEKDDEDIWMVHVVCPSTQREYFLGVDPNAYGGLKTARAAVASTWRGKEGAMVFKTPEDYAPLVET